ncbi:HipA domain-containing protein [Myroides odoratimimus]|uniref:HipA domain-containing protein n=1 Tax=Myroides odoratimimus TaxID=76832 RepID=UPI002575413C|nr:HipA domain-containing protein [Myroides odoratimimus]MDM1039152.1 HipA domain-containing protein [Myroides odoratimimus]MDM1053339.1 HipA domain-containing protein [Myroides odoratimimus]MDM1094934.1 HipA domain-containing protein [Myroides odoratimimus]MDM1411547.1 HipA domain-containing protein [Myroides odoratimimus]
MNNCLFCYKPVETGEYHTACSKKFFSTTQVPILELDKEKIDKLAQITVNERLALTGVQPKISLSLNSENGSKRLTLVGLWGDYILRPQSPDFAFMPEVEDLTMHLAKLFKIETAQHALIKTSTTDLAYITKRFDREKGKKIHIEDLCQLSELLTEQKYKSSYERVGKIIKQYTTNSGLDVIKYFRLVLFSFITGNNDMHLKNFSLMHTDNGILFSPAYDLLNVNLIFPDDKEDLALTISGRKKKIQQVNFDELALNLGITEVVRNNIYKDFSRQTNKVYDLIDRSFLTNEYKEEYKRIYTDKLRQIGL